jgi:2-oxo-4-hydroxy-4-carboxy-5-ureidoimidazoline decarboxylase
VTVPAGLDRLNRQPAAEAERSLLACCGSAAWARSVAAARPYGGTAALRAAAEATLDQLSWADLAEALAGHPRLGERPAGAGQAAKWSAGEQAGVAAADPAGRAALAVGNVAYERRFGHVYLACATGRSATELLALLETRLGNDEPTERAVVRAELVKITWLRLAKLLEAGS